jgi:hypothetical protein
LYEPQFVAAGRDGSTWFTISSWLYRVNNLGAIRRVWAPETRNALSPPAIDESGNAVIGYWPTGTNARLVRVTPHGNAKTLLGSDTGCDASAAARTCGDGSLATSATVAHQVVSVAIAPDGDIYFADQGGEIRYIPHGVSAPTRLAVSASAPTHVRRRGSLRIAFRTDASAIVTLVVAGHAGVVATTGVPRLTGMLTWHADANHRQLQPGHYTLHVIASDTRGRSASRILPIEITKP